MEKTDDWGLIAVHDLRLENQGISKREVTLEEGGL